MNGTDNNPLLEAGLRHELTAKEQARVQAYVSTHQLPDTDWQPDMALNQLLRELPSHPLSSNFTARVMQAVASEQKSPICEPCTGFGFIRRWLPKMALGAVLLAAGLLSYHQYQNHARTEMASSVARFYGLTKVLGVDMMQDFDAINRFSQTRVKIDEDLLAALK